MPTRHAVFASIVAFALAGSAAPTTAQDDDDPFEATGVISVEAKGHTFKACGNDTDAIALSPSHAATNLVEQARRENKRRWAASKHYVYAKVKLTYVRDAKQRSACIGDLRGVSKCATLGPTFTLYGNGSPGRCSFW